MVHCPGSYWHFRVENGAIKKGPLLEGNLTYRRRA
jgi:hypothetical protein